MIEFVDDRHDFYRFEHAFFSWSESCPAPPDIPGCYMLLDPNRSGSDGIGKQTVLYVGQTKTLGLRERMVWHAGDNLRFAEIGRWIRKPYRKAQYEVLYVPYGEGCQAHFSEEEFREFPDPLVRLEQRLKYLFVPLARCEEHVKAINGGRAAGKTNQVELNVGGGRLAWVRPAVAPVAA
jgi:hypothetical protein